MLYYVIQSVTGAEKKFISMVESLISEPDGKIIWPRRSILIRRRGREIPTEAPLYPGYLFWLSPELSPLSRLTLRKIPGFIRFLCKEGQPAPLSPVEARVLQEITSGGDLIVSSTVEFDLNNRIKVIDGPLKSLQGSIIKVDRRKGRATVRLSIHERSIDVSLGFEVFVKS